MKRNAYCGCINENDINKKHVTVCGWVHSHRDHGGIIFIDLRDKSGLLQIVFRLNNKNLKLFKMAKDLKDEYVICVKGLVQKRSEDTINLNMFTGKVELIAEDLKIFNKCAKLPFEISIQSEISEELRLKYRYLDLRRPSFQKNFIIRHKIANEVRNFLNEEGFLDIDTPLLTKSTPEGARDFLVPSRLHHGSFFALPQSPQLFKQILMISGFDKYYQFAKCFRDEDLRTDRQLEFTQIDIEMSFVEEDEIMNITERMLSRIFKVILNLDIIIPFKRISYDDAILLYGSDKPDTRFGMEIKDFSQEFKNSNFRIFSSVISNGGIVRGLCVPEENNYFSRSKIEDLTKFVCSCGAKGLLHMRISNFGIESNVIKKYLKKEELNIIKSKFNAKPGDLIIFIMDKDKEIVIEVLAKLRLRIGKELKFIDKNKYSFLWVVDSPLVKWDTGEQKWKALHHPFTSPKNDNIFNNANISTMKSRAYDIILNGIELGGGSIRIHETDIQKKIFEILNISDKIVKEKFGFLLDALNYGAPPHGGIALGFDRICSLIVGERSIREVIAFPKTQKTLDLLSGAPSIIEDEQLKDLGLHVAKK
ncbi:MAG: aspartate--tRNA ligase [Endomicrobium sp.]|jgi:aspartyl-tRNA synthetase|nr:aspartate--tRNA ligase [Endomicrobium sp.]